MEIGRQCYFWQQIEDLLDRVEYVFAKDDEDFFHRTRYLNVMIHMCKTDVAVVCDADVVCHPANIKRAYKFILEGCDVALPYSGLFLDVPEIRIPKLLGSPNDFPRVHDCNVLYRDGTGGMVFFNKQSICTAGYYNENFKSWGHEDRKLLHRMKMFGQQLKYVNGHMYHIHHPRYQDSHPMKNPYFGNNCNEYDKVKSMDLQQLKQYVENFSWIKSGIQINNR